MRETKLFKVVTTGSFDLYIHADGWPEALRLAEKSASQQYCHPKVKAIECVSPWMYVEEEQEGVRGRVAYDPLFEAGG